MSCPICDGETVHRWRPFCSKRCADVDLGRWFTGSYRVADAGDEERRDPPDEGPETGH